MSKKLKVGSIILLFVIVFMSGMLSKFISNSNKRVHGEKNTIQKRLIVIPLDQATEEQKKEFEEIEKKQIAKNPDYKRPENPFIPIFLEDATPEQKKMAEEAAKRSKKRRELAEKQKKESAEKTDN